WARRNKSVTHTAIDDLLKVLLRNFPGCGLPKTAKTLLGTTQMTNTMPIQGGEYVHMGLGPVITAFMDEYSQAKLVRDRNYHHGETILKKIPNLGLVSNVTLDYMHLLCLGVMKKLLLLWIIGPIPFKLGRVAVEQISQRMTSCIEINTRPGEI
ncbi:hypothetical protein PV328_012301, partial [Microctonus aethiopoides]